jgi:SEC-C motif-containing protein
MILPEARDCPCCSGKQYVHCCGPLHRGAVVAKTAVQLMRSRFSAYALKQIDYLYETTYPEKRSESFKQEMAAWANRAEFIKLEILGKRQGRSLDKVGQVEFIAYYRQFGEEKQMHELSRFRRYKGRWHYVDGVIE